MIQIYDAITTDFNSNGNVIFPSLCRIHVVLNGAWELSLEHPIDKDGRWKYIADRAIIKCPSFNGDQLWRIKQKKKGMSQITATAEPIFMDAKDDCFLMDIRPTLKNGQDAIDLMTAPNSKYRGYSDITQTATAYYQTQNLLEAVNGRDDNSFVNRWGGEILFDNYNITINRQIGGDYGVQVLYGKNIEADGISEEVNDKEVITRVVPKAFNGHMIKGDSPWVDSPLINAYPVVKYGVMKFEDVKMRADAQEEDEEKGVTICDTQEQLDDALRNKCRGQYEQGLDKPKVTIAVKMALTRNTVNYKGYQDIEKVSLGDTIHCKHYNLDISVDARVIELEYDSILDQIHSVVIGQFQYNYFDRVSSTIDRIDTAIRPDGSVVAEQISGIIDGIKSQMRAQSSIAKKSSVRAMLFEDLDPNSPTYGAMCMGTMGFQIAGARTADGRNWNWSTFGTGKGFFADLIVAGDMLADRIRGGTLEIGGATGKDGVIRVLDAPGNEIGHWDKSGLSVKQGDISGTSITLGGANNNYGLLKLLGADGGEIVRLDRNGVYAKGKYVCASADGTKQVYMHNGGMRFWESGGYSCHIKADNTPDGGKIMIYPEQGDSISKYLSISSWGLYGQFREISFSADSEIFLRCNKLRLGDRSHSAVGKSGRAEFSDGSYMEFKHGVLTGGRTQGGGSI